MGFTARPPSQESTIFNPNYYALSTDVLSLEMADTLYLSKTDYRMSYLSSITMGEAAPMSALVVDANRSISGINTISCSSIQLNGSSVDLSILSLLSASPGTATASKAVILNSNKEIATLNSIDSVSYKQNGVAYDLSRLSAAAGTAEASKALITDSAYGISGLRSLIIKDSGLSKSLVVQNDVATSAASLNIVSYYQMEQGVRGNTSATTPNCYFWRYALSDRLLMDINGNMAIGQATVNTSYKLDVSGAIRATSFVQGTTTYDLSKISLLSLTTNGTAEASKALITDSAYGITGIRSLTVKDSGLAKSLIVENTIASSAASMNFVSSYQAQVGVRGSSNPAGTNQFFINYALADVLTIDSAGNVNIPYSLTVAGQAITPASNTYSIPAGTVFNTTTRTSDYNLIISNASDTTGSTSAICFAVDDSAYNTYTPSVALIATRVATSIQYAASDFDIQLRSNTNILSPMVSRLMIKRAGGIGIGTTAPTGSVSIVGNSSYAAGGWRRIMYLSNDSTTPITAEIQIVSANSGTSPANGLWLGTISDDPVKIGCGNTSVMYINTSNRVAINLSGSTWSPEADLHVNGQIWSNAYYHSKQNVDGKAVYRTNWSQSNYLAWGTDATVGAMRLGVCDSNFNWVSYSPCRGGSYTNASDRRIKQDIIDIPYGLAEVMQMQPRKFAMRNDQSQHVGFIAQEMLEIIPECISGVESPNDELNDQGEPIDPMGIDLSSLVSVLCRAIQELKKELDNLRATIA